MHATQLSWSETGRWHSEDAMPAQADLVLFFGTREVLGSGARYDELSRMFPGAHLLSCSTGGQIRNDDIIDDEIAAVAMSFDHTPLKLACAPAADPTHSFACGEQLGRDLHADDLAGIFVLSDGLNVNGSELVRGIVSVVGNRVSLTGGMAGDGDKFETTLVGGDCAPRSHNVAAVGFYGMAVRIGHGSAGGWDEFGPRRRVTRSIGNVLYELDGEPALDLYVRYLGEEAKGLPGSALLFPLRIQDPRNPGNSLVRTILSVDHSARSMTFAGDIPQDWTTQLMRGNFDRLAAGAAEAARQASVGNDATDNGVAILVSCIGRRLLMGQRTIEEVEAAGAEFGPRMPRFGFYSYGEISPHGSAGVCQLHNQTMTVTTITEAAA